MAAIKGMGTSFKVGDGASPTEGFTAIAGIKSIGIPGLSADTADTTTLASTSNYEEALSTVLRTGDLTLSISWDPDDTQHQGFLTDYASGAVKNYQIVFTDATPTTFQFGSIVTGVSISIETGSEVTAEVTFKNTGVPNFAA